MYTKTLGVTMILKQREEKKNTKCWVFPLKN